MENRENVGKEAKKEVLIIIPAYNEEKTIVTLLEKLEQPEIAQVADVLVVNDASQDKTMRMGKCRILSLDQDSWKEVLDFRFHLPKRLHLYGFV